MNAINFKSFFEIKKCESKAEIKTKNLIEFQTQ